MPSRRHIRPSLSAAFAASMACAACASDGERDVPLPGVESAATEPVNEVWAATDETAIASPDASVVTRPMMGPELGGFEFTYYWMASEKSSTAALDVQLYTKRCEPLAKVSRAFADKLELEGTGRLRDGRTLNVSGLCGCPKSPCFVAVEGRRRWGMGVGTRPLSPFRSVAVDPDIIPIGTALYIPELDGLTMPGRDPWGGFVHDGCVSADDRGGKVAGRQIDFYTTNKAYYRALDKRHRIKRVTVFDGRGRCKREGYDVVRINNNAI